MNFSTEKMAKALDLPSKAYLNELKSQKPALYARLQGEYDGSFQKFFGGVVERIKNMLSKEINVKMFVEACQKEFEKRNEFEKELTSKRKVEIVADGSPTMVGKPMRAQAVGEYVFSDDEFPVPPSGTSVWQSKYEMLEKDFMNLNIRYSQCKAALSFQLQENARLQAELDAMKDGCVCQSIQEILTKRKRVD